MRDQRWDRLVAWYLAQRRSLPWREHPTAYRVWVSEIMLQQTQVATVLPYFARWMKRFPTVEALAGARPEDVLKVWAGLGYYRRARFLHEGAKCIVGRITRGEGWPSDASQWRSIPGVGRYTAGAICSIALGQREPIVDGNIERVFSRVFRLGRLRSKSREVARLWKTASGVLVATAGRTEPGTINQALMELGATVCTPRKPLCRICPLRSRCAAFEKQDVERFPRPEVKARVRKVTEHVACCVDEKGFVLLVQGRGKWREGLWDFPEWSLVNSRKKAPVAQGEFQYSVTVHRVRRRYTMLRGARRTFRLASVEGGRWVSSRDPEVPMGSPAAKMLRRVYDSFADLNNES